MSRIELFKCVDFRPSITWSFLLYVETDCFNFKTQKLSFQRVPGQIVLETQISSYIIAVVSPPNFDNNLSLASIRPSKRSITTSPTSRETTLKFTPRNIRLDSSVFSGKKRTAPLLYLRWCFHLIIESRNCSDPRI